MPRTKADHFLPTVHASILHKRARTTGTLSRLRWMEAEPGRSRRPCVFPMPSTCLHVVLNSFVDDTYLMNWAANFGLYQCSEAHPDELEIYMPQLPVGLQMVDKLPLRSVRTFTLQMLMDRKHIKLLKFSET